MSKIADLELEDYFLQTFQKQKGAGMRELLGTEYEYFVLRSLASSPRYRPLPMDGDPGVYELLSLIHQIAQEEGAIWEKRFENNKLIGLFNSQQQTITIEPGGQFEFSGAPLSSLQAIHEEQMTYLQLLSQAIARIDGKILSLGLNPLYRLQEIPLLDKRRYQIMFPHMKKVGSHGQLMMKGTTATQVSLDYFSVEDLQRKFVFLNRLSPFLTAIFANSPLLEGKSTGYLSFRGRIWLDTDPVRAGLPMPFLKETFQLNDYIQWALQAPPYFLMRDKRAILLTDTPFRKLLAGKHPEIQVQADDWELHLGMLFPEVRIKQIIEVRAPDAQLPENSIAIPALLKALVYDEHAFERIHALLMDLPLQDFPLFQLAGAREGLHAEVHGVNFANMARNFFEIGLSALGSEEEEWLLPYFDKYTKDGNTPADLVLRHFTDSGNDVESWAEQYFTGTRLPFLSKV